MDLRASAARTQASGWMRTHRSPLRWCEPTMASPSLVVRSSRRAWWRSSTGTVDVSAPALTSADDNRLPSPALRHVLVLDALLQEDDALQQRLGPRRAARHVDVDRDDLVHALGHGVRVPVRAAAVGARTH